MSELEDRLQRASDEIGRLCNKAAAMHNMTEYARLSGKREGIELALSYLQGKSK